MSLNNRPVGIFDSGVGGLTVVGAILDQLPEEDIIYYGDTARFPYGPKDLKEVRRYVFQITEYLIDQGVKIVVIACNTGTAAGLPEAQKRYDVPIIGVIEPGAHAAVTATVNRKIGVIGTEGTITSGSYQETINAFDAGIEVVAQACPRFVEFAQRGETDGLEVITVAEEYLAPLQAQGADTVILGCTHYPLLAGVISRVMGPGVRLISSAVETASEVGESLIRRGFLREASGAPAHRFIVSGDEREFKDLITLFLGRSVEAVEKVTLD
ncbi:MAG: glutamate racemase [Actinomycetota bacterium]